MRDRGRIREGAEEKLERGIGGGSGTSAGGE